MNLRQCGASTYRWIATRVAAKLNERRGRRHANRRRQNPRNPHPSFPMLQSEIDALRIVAVPPQQHFIGGAAVESESEARLDVRSPIDGKPLTTIADASAAEWRHGALHGQSCLARARHRRQSSLDGDPDRTHGRRGSRGRAGGGPYLGDRTTLRFAELVERELGGFRPPPGL